MIILTKDNFDKRVLQEDKLVLVDFWAHWCPPCRAMMPILEELDAIYYKRVHIFKLNLEKEPDYGRIYDVKTLPTLMFFKNGKPIDTIIGLQPIEALKSRIEQHLKG